MTADELTYDKPWDYNPYLPPTPLADEFHDAVATLAKEHGNACYQELATLIWKGYATSLALDPSDYDRNARAGRQRLESMLATAREKRRKYQAMCPSSKRTKIGAEAHERKPCDNDYERQLRDEELASLHNAWMHDVQAWMNQHTLECYQSRVQQEAHQYMRKQFNNYIKNMGVHKQVLMKLIKHQNYKTVQGMKELLDALNKYWKDADCENLRRLSRENPTAMKQQRRTRNDIQGVWYWQGYSHASESVDCSLVSWSFIVVGDEVIFPGGVCVPCIVTLDGSIECELLRDARGILRDGKILWEAADDAIWTREEPVMPGAKAKSIPRSTKKPFTIFGPHRRSKPMSVHCAEE